MELRQLRYFAAVARDGSFSKASEKLHIAQPALSRQIHMLEEEFGVELLTRTARGAEMTEAGMRLKEMAEFVLRYVAEIKPSLSCFANEPSGSIVLGLPPSLAYLLAPRLVEEAARRYPLLKLCIIEGLSVFLADWLEQARIDIAVLTDYGPIAGIERREVADEDMVFVGSPARLKASPKPIPYNEIAQYPFITSRGFRSLLEPRLLAANIQPSFDMELDSILIVKEMVLRGLYCSILSYSMVHQEVTEGRLVARRFEEPPIRRRIVTALTANRPPSVTINAVEGLVKQELLRFPLRLPGARSRGTRAQLAGV